MTGRAYLAIVDHGYRDLPWHAELTEIIVRHSRSPGEAAAFDRAVAGLVRPYAVDGLLDLPVAADLAWGRITATAAG